MRKLRNFMPIIGMQSKEQPSHGQILVLVSAVYTSGYLATSGSGRILKNLNLVHL